MDYEDTDLLKGKFSKYLWKSSGTKKFYIRHCTVIVKILLNRHVHCNCAFVPSEKNSQFSLVEF